MDSGTSESVGERRGPLDRYGLFDEEEVVDSSAYVCICVRMSVCVCMLHEKECVPLLLKKKHVLFKWIRAQAKALEKEGAPLIDMACLARTK